MPQETLFRTSLAGSVRAELARRQITIRQAAAATDIKPSTLARRLATGDFKLGELERLARLLDMRVSDLLPDESTEPVAS